MTTRDPALSDVDNSWLWSRAQIEQWQLHQFNRQLDAILPQNSFYLNKLRSEGISASTRLTSLADLAQWPFTTKQDLVEGAERASGGWCPHQTYPPNSYSRLHRTSGTRGKPLMIGDTLLDWQWWSSTWQHVLSAAELTSSDRVFLAFSFGPFIGFWSAHQACVDRGAMVIPAGGLSSIARLEFLKQSAATVVCCTPTYALHLAEVAHSEGFDLAGLPVRLLIVAGEPGGSLPELRNAIQQSWQAEVVDHAGATEIGPWGFGWPNRCGLHVIESSFIAEILPLPQNSLDLQSSEAVSAFAETKLCTYGNNDQTGVVGELVLTSLGRWGAPVIRYRTGDVVRAAQADSMSLGCNFLWLPDGIVGRTDDMLTIRGVNIFPSSIDSLIRNLAPRAEYVARVSQAKQLQQLTLEVECEASTAAQIAKQLSAQMGLRVTVTSLPTGSLPRSEGKSQRWLKNQ